MPATWNARRLHYVVVVLVHSSRALTRSQITETVTLDLVAVRLAYLSAWKKKMVKIENSVLSKRATRPVVLGAAGGGLGSLFTAGEFTCRAQLDDR